MKRLIFLIFLLALSIYCMAQPVTLRGNDFYLGSERFYPLGANYSISLGIDYSGNYFLSTDHGYDVTNYFECYNMLTCSQQLLTHFNYAKEMGLNTLRIVGFYPQYNHKKNPQKFSFCFREMGNLNEILLEINPFDATDPIMLRVLSYYDKILELAHTAKIKIYFLLSRVIPENDEEMMLMTQFIDVVSAHLSHSPYKDALFAYDLINEPCYSQPKKLPLLKKQQACELVALWYDIIKANAPQHLVTLGNCGLESIGDVFSFDPSILKVDFLTPHFYPSLHPTENPADPNVQELIKKRTSNLTYWFQQYSVVPWMIGEGGFSATDIDGTLLPGLHGTLSHQEAYAQYALDAVCNCGGSGYTWWQFQDVDWGVSAVRSNFYGLLKRNHAPSLAADKPVVNVFRNYPKNPQPTQPCPVDYSPLFNASKIYYNSFGYPRSPGNEIERTVVDQNGNPIKDAVIRVWTSMGRDTVVMIVNGEPKDTSISLMDVYETYTDVTGKFIALPCPVQYGYTGTPTANFTPKIAKIRVSAAGASVFDPNNDYEYWNTISIKDVVPDTIVLNKINYEVVVAGQTISNGQTKTYRGRKSVTAYNTDVHLGGKADFTSQRIIKLLPGFKASAGSKAKMYIAFPDCEELSLLNSRNILLAPKNSPEQEEANHIELTFKKEFTENYISVYPNPANSTVTVQLNSNNKEASLNHITLYDVFGRIIFTTLANSTSFDLNVHCCSQGIYFIKATTSTTTCYQKLIIQ